MLDLGTLKIGVKVDADSAKSQLNEVGSAVTGTESKALSLASKAKMMIKAFAAAWAVKELVKLGKAALDAYAQFEQLEGGVKKLFGEESSKQVMKYAQEAYKTAGLSANQYMETVTSFSASLISSLGGDTKKAADVADMAIRDMSDNANTFGTDMASIQNAYQGFAKQNFTMLDNLKLGFAGSKEGMQQLLDKAGEITGKKYDISNLADIYEAIHVMQEELNIAGTTSKEAANTIEGSTNMMKAAWTNMLTAIGRGKGVEEATTKFLNSLGTVAKNVAPVAWTIIKALAQALIKAAVYLVKAGAEAMKEFISGFMDAHPKIAAAVETIGKVFNVVFSPVITIIKTVIKVWKLLMGQKSSKKFTVTAPFSGAISSIKSVYDKWKNVLGQRASKTFKVVKEGFASALESMRSVYNKWKDILAQKATKIFTVKNKKEGSGSGQRIGLREVPYDGYAATLHKGETVLTAAETNRYKAMLNAAEDGKTINEGSITINVYGSDNMNVRELAAAVEQRLVKMQKRRTLAWQ